MQDEPSLHSDEWSSEEQAFDAWLDQMREEKLMNLKLTKAATLKLDTELAQGGGFIGQVASNSQAHMSQIEASVLASIDEVRPPTENEVQAVLCNIIQQVCGATEIKAAAACVIQAMARGHHREARRARSTLETLQLVDRPSLPLPLRDQYVVWPSREVHAVSTDRIKAVDFALASEREREEAKAAAMAAEIAIIQASESVFESSVKLQSRLIMSARLARWLSRTVFPLWCAKRKACDLRERAEEQRRAETIEGTSMHAADIESRSYEDVVRHMAMRERWETGAMRDEEARGRRYLHLERECTKAAIRMANRHLERMARDARDVAEVAMRELAMQRAFEKIQSQDRAEASLAAARASLLIKRLRAADIAVAVARAASDASTSLCDAMAFSTIRDYLDRSEAQVIALAAAQVLADRDRADAARVATDAIEFEIQYQREVRRQEDIRNDAAKRQCPCLVAFKAIELAKNVVFFEGRGVGAPTPRYDYLVEEWRRRQNAADVLHPSKPMEAAFMKTKKKAPSVARLGEESRRLSAEEVTNFVQNESLFEACVERLESVDCLIDSQRYKTLKEVKINVNHLDNLAFAAHLPQLRVLSARDNHLDRVCKSWLPQSLHSLCVDVNVIETIEIPESLAYLSAADNRLEAVPPKLHCLTWLNLAGNDLGPHISLDNNSSLKHLDVSRNELVSCRITGATSLETLVASNNRLSTLMVRGLRLHSLRLNDNRLVRFDNLTWLPECTELFASTNRLQSVSEALVCCPSLTMLDCSHNSIHDAKGVCYINHHLRHLSVNGNPLRACQLSKLVETVLKVCKRRHPSNDAQEYARSLVFARSLSLETLDGASVLVDSSQLDRLDLLCSLFPRRCVCCSVRQTVSKNIILAALDALRIDFECTKCKAKFCLPPWPIRVKTRCSSDEARSPPFVQLPTSAMVVVKNRSAAVTTMQRFWRGVATRNRRAVQHSKLSSLVVLQPVARGRALRRRLKAALNDARYVDEELDDLLRNRVDLPDIFLDDAESVPNKWTLPTLSQPALQIPQSRESEPPHIVRLPDLHGTKTQRQPITRSFALVEKKSARARPPPPRPQPNSRNVRDRLARTRRSKKLGIKPAWADLRRLSCATTDELDDEKANSNDVRICSPQLAQATSPSCQSMTVQDHFAT